VGEQQGAGREGDNAARRGSGARSETRPSELPRSGALAGLRALDLTGECGFLCGKMLADLGVEVVMVEPPGGAALRAEPHFWTSYARNKHSLVADLATPAGRAGVLELARHADFFLESHAPGELAALGLGYPDLARVNPALVYVSITPFGQNGPKAHWRATDLIVAAAAGPLLLQGDDDRPPVRISAPQALLHAGAEAAVGALIAHAERVRSGRGQHVDVSAQQAHAAATQAEILSTRVGENPGVRHGGGLRMGDVRIRFSYPARDGNVSITHAFGAAMGPATQRLMRWLGEIGECDADLAEKDWVGFGARILRGQETMETLLRAQAAVAAATAKRTKAELLALAMEKKLLIAPSATPSDLLASEQFAARGTLERVAGVTAPGRFAVLSRTPIAPATPAPALGASGARVIREWSAPRAAPPSARGHEGETPVSPSASAATALPLAGVKVLDFSWAIAGPTVTRTLGDYGATVVRVEGAARPDPCRTTRPFLGGRFGSERSAIFHTMNANKLQLGLDLAKPEARGVILDLARWADVVIESFAPGVITRLGFDYATLAQQNPRLIYLSTSLLGQNGPHARLAGFGNLGAALSGIWELVGWPDRAPSGPFAAYTDYVAPRFSLCAVLAALEHRRRTGEGQFIDVSQVESALQFIAPVIAGASATGRNVTRAGNADPHFVLHGVFPAAGEGRWIAIAARTQAEWSAAARVLGCEAGAADERAVAAVTARHDAHALAERLQAAGVPAHAVQSSADLSADPQLAARGHFFPVEHPSAGASWIESSRIRLSRTPARVPSVAPSLGGDNELVLRELLGYDDERISELAIAEALQ
jgi:crotonobetainyl-CoA:carnitine CoA-transferase CaiB-like acyl-CoA transferase